jgi:hypothetical protein
MRIETRELYTFKELSKTAQERALQAHQYINVADDWWDVTYEYAAQVGIEIMFFDLDHQKIDCVILEPVETAREILHDHVGKCGTHTAAKRFLDEVLPKIESLEALYSDEVNETGETRRDELDGEIIDIKAQFSIAISKEYLRMLREDYDYQTSDEVVAATLILRDYEFLPNGEDAY